MIRSIRNFVTQPYPFYYEPRNLRWLLPGIFVFGTLFLYFFQPFNNNWEEHKYPFLVICALHSLTAVLCLSPFFVFAHLGEKDKNNWTLLKEFLLMLFAFVTVGVGNFLIRDLIYESTNSNWATSLFLEEVRNALLIGLIIYPIFLMLNNTRLRTRHEKEGLALSKDLAKDKKNARQEIQLLSTSGQTELSLSMHELLFIKSEGNYVRVYYRKEGVEKKMIRNTLTTLAEQLPDLFRAHRSYLVNLEAVDRIGGNSQGYTLHFEDCALAIPVSRSKKEMLVQHRQQVGL